MLCGKTRSGDLERVEDVDGVFIGGFLNDEFANLASMLRLDLPEVGWIGVVAERAALRPTTNPSELFEDFISFCGLPWICVVEADLKPGRLFGRDSDALGL